MVRELFIDRAASLQRDCQLYVAWDGRGFRAASNGDLRVLVGTIRAGVRLRRR
jgi:hypothetical protein